MITSLLILNILSIVLTGPALKVKPTPIAQAVKNSEWIVYVIPTQKLFSAEIKDSLIDERPGQPIERFIDLQADPSKTGIASEITFDGLRQPAILFLNPASSRLLHWRVSYWIPLSQDQASCTLRPSYNPITLKTGSDQWLVTYDLLFPHSINPNGGHLIKRKSLAEFIRQAGSHRASTAMRDSTARRKRA